MSTIKSSAENLTLNADGANNDIKFQSNGSEVASIDQAGLLTVSSLIVAGTNANLTFASSGNNMTFARNSSNYISATGGSSSNLTLDGQSKIALNHNGTEKLRVTANGLTFNGDTAAANALDDYEEGTWTPSIGGNAGYYAQNGVYTKIGQLVTVSFDVTLGAIGTGSTNVISGLPFTENGNPLDGGLALSYFDTLALSSVNVCGEATGTVINIYSSSGAGIAVTGRAIFKVLTRIAGSISYKTNS